MKKKILQTVLFLGIMFLTFYTLLHGQNLSEIYQAVKNMSVPYLIAAAGLDVITTEPVAKDNPLLTIKDSNKLIVTPHVAWATYEARTRLMDEIYLNIKAFMVGQERNVIV